MHVEKRSLVGSYVLGYVWPIQDILEILLFESTYKSSKNLL